MQYIDLETDDVELIVQVANLMRISHGVVDNECMGSLDWCVCWG